MARATTKKKTAPQRAEKSNPELDRLAMEVANDPAPAVEEVGEGPSLGPIITPEQFEAGFIGAFNIAAHASGLQSLRVSPGDPGAAAAARAIYDIANETPMLRFLIEGGNPWIGRVVAIAAFGVPLARNLSAEIHERRQTKTYEAANDSGQSAEA